MIYQHNEKSMDIKRYPKTENKSLRSWSAADEFILLYIDQMENKPESIALCNDRFGFLSCFLHSYSPVSITDTKSQEKALNQNLRKNSLFQKKGRIINPLVGLKEEISLGIINVPKSMELFRLYLYQLAKALKEDGEIICAFMTRHYTPQMLSIAGEFFENVEQSKARKKARLITLKGKKQIEEIELINEISYKDDKVIKQYYGVFSSGNIDFATQFLIDNINVSDEDKKVLDLASGNGILGAMVREKNKECEIHFLDDSFLAVASSKLNVDKENMFFHYNDTTDDLEKDSFDLVVSNPPFHFEYETNIEVSLSLFEGVREILKKGGRFQLVANRHLNYYSHLVKLFPDVNITAENEKYVIYECVK